MRVLLKVILFLLVSVPCLFAHEGRPVFVEFEVSKEVLRVSINIPNTVSLDNLPFLELPDGFELDTLSKKMEIRQGGFVIKEQYKMVGNHTLKGSEVQLKFSKYNPSITTIIQYTEFAQLHTQTIVNGPGKEWFLIKKENRWTDTIKEYTLLGMKHIWSGVDHLLFVACLLFITGITKKLLFTITGFTIAHSITLILSVLGWIQVSTPPVEACIALSILFLAVEIVKNHTSKKSLTYRYPVLVSSTFGLLHGLGFAAVLMEIGLPERQVITALLFFNVGVELGQLTFIITSMGIIIVISFFLKKEIIAFLFDPITKVILYCIGILAAFWFFDRLF